MLGMLTSKFIPAACEVDVMGAVSMLALELASGTSSAILDWDNNYGDDPDKAIVFHCSNLPAEWLNNPQMVHHISPSFKQGCAYGAIFGRITAGPFTFLRISTDDENGELKCFTGEGQFTDDPLERYGVIEIPDLQMLLREICLEGFEHHFAASRGNTEHILKEAIDTYLPINSVFDYE
jgi:L-fucose isomerase-like protein